MSGRTSEAKADSRQVFSSCPFAQSWCPGGANSSRLMYFHTVISTYTVDRRSIMDIFPLTLDSPSQILHPVQDKMEETCGTGSSGQSYVFRGHTP